MREILIPLLSVFVFRWLTELLKLDLLTPVKEFGIADRCPGCNPSRIRLGKWSTKVSDGRNLKCELKAQ